jgi:hypothetical protein
MINKLQLCIFSFLLSVSIQAQQIKVSFSPSTFEGVFSGKVILYISKDGKNPKDLSVGIPKLSCFSIEVSKIKPNTNVLFDDDATSFPEVLSELERGDYYVQVVWDRNLGERNRNIGTSVGNMYSEPIKVNFTKNTKKKFSILCDKVIPAPVFIETEYVKELKVPSLLLSGFHKQAVSFDAAVIFPKEYYLQPHRKFPTHYFISGFGGNYYDYSNKDEKSMPLDTTACITVFLDGICSNGHTAYANSDNNGPWGDALVKEFIPFLEKNYRCNQARLLSGHSSGGWAALWLQTNYPSTFAGCWSSAPDPVDFRSFGKLNLYSDKNMFYDKDGNLRLDAAVAGGIPWLYVRDDYRIENVLYRGEQFNSWNAVFGKRTIDNSPEKIADFGTGEIDNQVVMHWKEYDISDLIRTNWEQLKPHLDSKVRISVGNQDNYFLNYAVELLEKEMKTLEAKVVFAYYPGDHFTIETEEYRKEGYSFLEKKYKEWLENSAR